MNMSGLMERSKNRDPLQRFKSESPKFKDALRKKCHQRWLEKRWSVLDNSRCLFENPSEQKNVSEIVKKDIQSLYLNRDVNDTDKKLDELKEIETEAMDEELQWYLSEYNKVLEDDDQLCEMLEELNHIVCPICQKYPFDLEPGSPQSTVTCPCGIRILTTLDLPQIKERITTCFNEHNDGCVCDPQFILIDESNEKHIYLLCYICTNFTMLI